MGKQREESSDEILIFIVDESYGREWEFVDVLQYEGEVAQRDAASNKYLSGLREEFKDEFQDVNVGPGADVPAFLLFCRVIYFH